MALYWEHIKGFNGEASPTSGSTPYNKPLYTYLEYQQGPTGTLDSALQDFLPHLLVSLTNIQGNLYENGSLKTGVYDAGSILTSKSDQTVEGQFSFKNHVYIQSSTVDGDWGDCYYDDTYDAMCISLSGGGFILTSGDGSGPMPQYFANDIHLNTNDYGYVHLNNSLHAQLNTTGSHVIVGEKNHTNNNALLDVYGQIKATKDIEGLYFNATSDKRAKENFIPIPNNMLELVEKMQVYTFNYKNNISERTIGLIAQEVEDINIDGFSIVANKTALGKEDDFMSIHESKLVYILLEAVKELSAQVKELKSKIGE